MDMFAVYLSPERDLKAQAPARCEHFYSGPPRVGLQLQNRKPLIPFSPQVS